MQERSKGNPKEDGGRLMGVHEGYRDMGLGWIHSLKERLLQEKETDRIRDVSKRFSKGFGQVGLK